MSWVHCSVMKRTTKDNCLSRNKDNRFNVTFLQQLSCASKGQNTNASCFGLTYQIPESTGSIYKVANLVSVACVVTLDCSSVCNFQHQGCIGPHVPCQSDTDKDKGKDLWKTTAAPLPSTWLHKAILISAAQPKTEQVFFHFLSQKLLTTRLEYLSEVPWHNPCFCRLTCPEGNKQLSIKCLSVQPGRTTS